MSMRHGRPGKGIATKCRNLKAYEQYAKQYIEAECAGERKMKIDTSKGISVANLQGRQLANVTVPEDQQLRYVHLIEVTQTYKRKMPDGKEKTVTEGHDFWFDITTSLAPNLKKTIEAKAGIKREKAPE
jgi:hypothetical protein